MTLILAAPDSWRPIVGGAESAGARLRPPTSTASASALRCEEYNPYRAVTEWFHMPYMDCAVAS